MRKIKYCQLCGKRIWMQGYNIQNRIAYIMNKDNVCFECAFWQDLIDYPPEYMEVVNNQCVRLHPVANKKDKTLRLGGKGKLRYFMRPDYSLLQSNDIWIIGTIPERFRSQLPTTAIEISLKAYRQLNKSTKKCRARACFDRYNCFRYDITLEKDNGPFNSIPPKWKVGDEHCGFFINLEDIKFDESSVINKLNSNATTNQRTAETNSGNNG